MCEIENVWYCYDHSKCLWYDTKCEVWRSFVKGLSGLDEHYTPDTEICNYGGKLVSVLIDPARNPLIENPEMWCAVILLEKCNDGEISGHIEWTHYNDQQYCFFAFTFVDLVLFFLSSDDT